MKTTKFFILVLGLLSFAACKKNYDTVNPNNRAHFGILAKCSDTSKLHVTYTDSNYNTVTDTGTRWDWQPGYISNFFVCSGQYTKGQAIITAWATDTSIVDIIFSTIGEYNQPVAEITGKGKQTLKYTIPEIF